MKIFLMFQTGSEKRAAHGVSLFLVDADTPGFHKGRKLNKLGLKGQDTAELFFEDVRVPASALLGQVSQTNLENKEDRKNNPYLILFFWYQNLS